MTTTELCPHCHTYCYGDCGHSAQQQHANIDLATAIVTAGYTTSLWERGGMRRLYVNCGRTSLGYIDLGTRHYSPQRREGTNLWSTLRQQNLINA